MKNTVLTYAVMVGITLIALLCIKIFNISYPLTIKTYTQLQSELSVVGEGTVDVIPDTAYIDLGIAVNHVFSVQEAQRKITEANNAIIESIVSLGVDKKDITTSNFSIYQGYDHAGNIDGYNGNASLSIKVRNISLVSSVIEKATEAGANTIDGTRFTVDKPEKYREQARDLAIKNARKQAEKIAKNLGIRLGKVTNIIESSPSNLYPVYEGKTMIGLGGAGSADIESGTQTVTSVVTLFFEKR